MLLPAELVQIRAFNGGFPADLSRRIAIERGMNALIIVIVAEDFEFALKIVDITGLYAKVNDVSGELIHDAQDPMCVQCDGFAAK